MAVAEGTRAPTERLLFTDQCVYLSRKHLLWSRKGFGEAWGQLFPDQRHAEEKALALRQDRLLLVLDQYRTLRLCLRREVMETQKKLVVSCFISNRGCWNSFRSFMWIYEFLSKARTHKKGAPPPPDPEALILNGTLVPSPQEFIN